MKSADDYLVNKTLANPVQHGGCSRRMCRNAFLRFADGSLV